MAGYASEILNKIDDICTEINKKVEIPLSGKCDTFIGETVRALNQVIYRYVNDGDKCSTHKSDYGSETVLPSVLWLADIAKDREVNRAADNIICNQFENEDEDYEPRLLQLAVAVKAYIEKGEDEKCEVDSRNYRRG